MQFCEPDSTWSKSRQKFMPYTRLPVLCKQQTHWADGREIETRGR